ncbi:hypothetical protein Tsubulata_013583 [Turnera subulata]|uniref:HMA domain-containing protein n=1 Tax=Turnera subulata TaxID=218843 RepID=A0A9Q0FTX1_9ROSI|nr:hypothetical protein Tsubulata_013583 [Turnera subulata]
MAGGGAMVEQEEKEKGRVVAGARRLSVEFESGMESSFLGIKNRQYITHVHGPSSPKEAAKAEGEKKPADAGEKKDDGKAVSVYKMDMHCEGCAKKIKRVVKHMDGVEDVKADFAGNKLTVTGKVDPSRVKSRLEEKTKKKVDVVSPQPKKDGGAGEKKSEEKSDKKPEEKQTEEKKAPPPPKESTVVLKMRLHCDGCITKIKKTISKYKGVDGVTIDAAKDVVTVKGTMDVKELVPYLKEKFRRGVEVVPAKKDDDKKGGKEAPAAGGGGGDKKESKEGGGEGKTKEEKKGGGGDGEKKKEGGGDGGAKVEVSKMEYFGYPQPAPTYWFDGAYGDGSSSSSSSSGYDGLMAMHPYHHHYQAAQGYAMPYMGVVNDGYAMNHNHQQQHHHQGYVVDYHHHHHPMHAPQMFSDENPNACSIM